MSGLTRERGAAVIGRLAFHPVFSSLLYWFFYCIVGQDSPPCFTKRNWHRLALWISGTSRKIFGLIFFEPALFLWPADATVKRTEKAFNN